MPQIPRLKKENSNREILGLSSIRSMRYVLFVQYMQLGHNKLQLLPKQNYVSNSGNLFIRLLIYFLLPFVNNIDGVRIHIEYRFMKTVYKQSWSVRNLFSLKQFDKSLCQHSPPPKLLIKVRVTAWKINKDSTKYTEKKCSFFWKSLTISLRMNILILVGFGRACAPVRCAHPSLWAHC